MIAFTIPGEPRGKGRARFTLRGGKPASYTDAKTVAYEGMVAYAAQQAMGGCAPLNGPVSLAVTVCLGIPRSATRRAQAAMLAGATRPAKRPDLDNIIKAVLDGCNRVAFGDDAQVCQISAAKLYSATPGVHVTISPLECSEARAA